MKLLHIFSRLSVVCCVLSTAVFSHGPSSQEIDLSTKNFDFKVKTLDKEINKKAYQGKLVDAYKDPCHSENVKSSAATRTFSDDPHIMRNNPEPKSFNLNPLKNFRPSYGDNPQNHRDPRGF